MKQILITTIGELYEFAVMSNFKSKTKEEQEEICFKIWDDGDDGEPNYEYTFNYMESVLEKYDFFVHTPIDKDDAHNIACLIHQHVFYEMLHPTK